MAKLLILTGLFFIVAGLLWMAGDSLGLGNFLGHLPGDGEAEAAQATGHDGDGARGRGCRGFVCVWHEVSW